MANQQITEVEPARTNAESLPAGNENRPAPSPPRSRGRKLIPLLVLVVLGVAGYFLWTKVFSSPPVPDSIVPLSGRIEGDDSAVAPKTTGRILEVRFREGDQVKAGDIIATLDYQQIRAREEQARAALLQSQARFKSANDWLQGQAHILARFSN